MKSHEHGRPCPACQADEARPAGEKDGFEILVCRRCDSIYTSSLPAVTESEDYDAYYSEVNLTIPGFIKERVKEIVGGFAPYRRTGELLDIGFGSGILMDEAARQGWKPFGTEVSATACDHARGNGHDVFHGELRAAGFEAGRFDVVAASEILEHLAEPQAELNEIARILRPGGLLWATTPSARSLSFRLMGSRWTTISPPEHTQLYSVKGARLMLECAGFTKIELRTTGLNPGELINYYKGGPAGYKRVDAGYELQEKLTRSPARKVVKNSLNTMLNAFGMGDSLKIFAVKDERAG